MGLEMGPTPPVSQPTNVDLKQGLLHLSLSKFSTILWYNRSQESTVLRTGITSTTYRAYRAPTLVPSVTLILPMRKHRLVTDSEWQL